jgi:undecaprenyl-phosphate 4-deoxy-4-formamido-L-arabinose transferase
MYLSIISPVYRAEEIVEQLVTEIHQAVKLITDSYEIILVEDGSPDKSWEAILSVCERDKIVKGVKLSRNFGQHAATLAGMAATRNEWVVTMDEDLQHDPNEIGNLLDKAVEGSADIVYGLDSKTRVHGFKRSLASRLAKIAAGILMGNSTPRNYSSFRLVNGSIARGVSAYVGEGVYLDVALGWITERVSTCEVTNQLEFRDKSGYTSRKLFGHLLRLVLSNGTRPLRIVTISGVSIALTGITYAVFVIERVILSGETVPGWTSVIVSILVIGGLVLVSLGIIAEYVGLAVRAAFGKPNYFVIQNSRTDSEQ